MMANSGKVPYHQCFEVLGNELRIGIIRGLRRGPKSVSQLSKELGAEQSRLSHALQALKRCCFVCSERKGKSIVYSLTESFPKRLRTSDIFEALEKHYSEHGCVCWREPAK